MKKGKTLQSMCSLKASSPVWHTFADDSLLSAEPRPQLRCLTLSQLAGHWMGNKWSGCITESPEKESTAWYLLEAAVLAGIYLFYATDMMGKVQEVVLVGVKAIKHFCPGSGCWPVKKEAARDG